MHAITVKGRLTYSTYTYAMNRINFDFGKNKKRRMATLPLAIANSSRSGPAMSGKQGVNFTLHGVLEIH